MKGLVYPLSLSGGNLAITDDYPTLVKQAIVSGLMTYVEERVMRPEYGLDRLEFTNINDLQKSLIAVKQVITKALERYPEVEHELRGAINDDGLLDILVVYQCPDYEPRTLELTL